jgi:acetoin utilization protein AcuB
MTPDPVTVGPSASIATAARLMARRRIRRLPVVDGERLVGIVSELDVARAFPPDVNPFSAVVEPKPGDRTVGSVMTAHPVTVEPSTPIDEAAAVLRERRIGAVPVAVGPRLAGILTESDVFRAFTELLGVGPGSVSVTFDASDGEDVLAVVQSLAAQHRLRIASVLSFEHGGRRYAVARLRGHAGQRFVDDVWRSGHRVVAVSGA